MIQGFKDEVAQELGYPNWEEYYNWICRESNSNIVATQQIESSMTKVMDKVIELSFEMARMRSGYYSGETYTLGEIIEFIKTGK